MIGLTELRDFLRLRDDEHDDDSFIMQLEANAVAMVESATGYTYPAQGPVVEYVRGTGTDELFLGLTPTADPTEVLERAKVGDVGTAITSAQSDGWVRRGGRLVRKAGAVWIRGAEYQVTYVGGFVPDTEPGDVRQAVMQIVGVLFRGRGKDGLRSETVGGADSSYSYQKTDAAIKEITDALPHRGVFA